MTSSSRRLIGAGAAGVAAVLAGAPLAAHATPNASPTPTATHGVTAGAHASQQAPAPRDTTTTTAPVTPNYGAQKVRIGVQVKDGSFVPAGTTTAGTELTITESGPGVEGDNDTASTTITCTTDATTTEGTATFCTGGGADRLAKLRAKLGRTDPRLTVRPTPGSPPSREIYPLFPGDKLTITQTTVLPNLVKDTSTAVVLPCEADPDVPLPVCGTGDTESFSPLSTDVIFDDPGLPPTAADDSSSTKQDTAVVIDVTGNDNTFGAPITGLSVTSAPRHGTATPIAGEGTPAGPAPTVPPAGSSSAAPTGTLTPGIRPAAAPAVTVVGTTIRYTPDAGFHGTDTFLYRISDANGSATARVTVTVPAAVTSSASTTSSHTSSSASVSPSNVTTSNDTVTISPSLTPSSSSQTLANTGTNSAGLGGLAALLVVSGGALTVLGRRRHHGRHAGTR